MKTSILIPLAVSACLALIPVANDLHADEITAQDTGGDDAGSRKKAPALAGTTIDGEALMWSQFGGRTVAVYFHAARTLNAAKALEQFAKTLRGAKDIKDRCTILLVTDDAESGTAARDVLSPSGFEVVIGLSPERELFTAFEVVAFPTAFVVDGEARLVDSVRGYGTFFSFHVVAACRHALGLTDRSAYENLIHGQSEAKDNGQLRLSRQYRMACKMIAAGNSKAALVTLEGLAAKGEPEPDLMALIVHLDLIYGDGAKAQSWLDKLSEQEPDSSRVRLLKARILLAAGDVAGAGALAQRIEESTPATDYVQGLILEAEGEYERAAALYREALATTLFLPE